MSYILDALKKAERERGTEKVPTLGTIHVAAQKSGSVRRPAILFILILLAAVMGLYLYSRSGPDRDAPISGNVASQNPGVNQADTAPVDTTAQQVPSGFPQRRAVSEAVPPNATSKRIQPPPDPSPTPGTGGKTLPGLFSRQVQAVPAPEIPSEAAPDDEPSIFSLGEIPENRDPPSPAEDVSPRPALLNEAVQDMQVTIHLYSDAAENRKIYINGRKYAEGDYIDGIYLIESITPEGAVLSYQGTRAVLKAAD